MAAAAVREFQHAAHRAWPGCVRRRRNARRPPRRSPTRRGCGRRRAGAQRFAGRVGANVVARLPWRLRSSSRTASRRSRSARTSSSAARHHRAFDDAAGAREGATGAGSRGGRAPAAASTSRGAAGAGTRRVLQRELPGEARQPVWRLRVQRQQALIEILLQGHAVQHQARVPVPEQEAHVHARLALGAAGAQQVGGRASPRGCRCA